MWNELVRRLRVLLNRDRFDSDLEEELADHLRRKAEETGIDPRRQFGNVTLVKEESRNMWTWNWIEQLAQDVRYALRTMKANRLFTAMAVLSLALGIGANTAIYSFMDAIMLRALPVVHQPDRLVILNWRAKGESPVVWDHWGSNYDEPGGGLTSPNFPYPAFEMMRDQNSLLSSLFGHADAGRLNVVIDGQAELSSAKLVTGDYFAGLGVSSSIGRVIGREDDHAGALPVMIVTFDYWRSRFASDPAVLGKTVKLNGSAFTIVGVAAPEFFGVSPTQGDQAQLFIPMAQIGLVQKQMTADWAAGFKNQHFYWIELMGRLKPDSNLIAAQTQLAGQFHNFVAATATKDREKADLPQLWVQEGGSGVDAVRRKYSKPLWILTGMVGLILLIACANIANLMLARASARRREMAVRLSLGAGRFRVVRQLLTESLLLALAGAAAGIGVAALGIRLLLVLLAGDTPFGIPIGIDWRVLSFTLLIALVTGILFGLAPALQATRVDVTPALKEARSSAPTQGRARRFSLSRALVVAQISLSLLLVVGAGLFVRTLSNLRSVELGFNAEHVLLFNLDASKAGYKAAPLKHFYDDLQTRLQTLPGVRGATATDMPLVGGWNSTTSITVPGIPKPQEGQRGPNTAYARVGTTFFETMEIPILLGRPLDKRDVEGAQTTGVVNQIFVEKYFKGQNPIGRHFEMGGDKNVVDVEIVGVAKTARYSSLKREIPPVTYCSFLQAPANRPLQQMFFEVRTSGDPLALANTVRQIVREASPLVPVASVTTQTARIAQTISQERTFAQLCTCFGGLALLMACIGLYGTMAYAVARRTTEIGIRMALGAARGRIVWMVLREVLVLSAIGIALGFGAVHEGTEFVKSFLFGLKPNDPLALIASSSILLACALLAGFLPARRASRIDPITALRNE